MKQEVDVMAIFEKGKREPRPVKFRMIESGGKLTVDVVDILSCEYIGMNRIDYECNAIAMSGKILSYKLIYFISDRKWIISV